MPLLKTQGKHSPAPRVKGRVVGDIHGTQIVLTDSSQPDMKHLRFVGYTRIPHAVVGSWVECWYDVKTKIHAPGQEAIPVAGVWRGRVKE